MTGSQRRLVLAAAAGVALVAIAIPALAASPSPSATPSFSAEASPSAEPSFSVGPSPSVEPSFSVGPPPSVAPSASALPQAPTAVPKATGAPESAAPESAAPESAEPEDLAPTGPEAPISLKGTLTGTVDPDGRPAYTMTVGGTTWTISFGPPWFRGDQNPLAAFVGKTVTVDGTTHAGSAEVDVETVNGQALRQPGRPPWAGGPWVVGPMHPGWKAWMADGKPGHGNGRDSAPGQLKQASPAP
jgi:hypothetical protein